MLTKKQIKEIQEHLNKSQNPLFFFDNDQDGLCSFLLLKKYISRGKGVAVKSSPLDVSYFRKINELSPDYIFVLDVPEIKKDFFQELEKFNIPIVWIDHHKLNKEKLPEDVNYYNPLLNKDKKNEPTTYLCYQVTKKDEEIAIIGCISDKYVPKFWKKFQKKYPDLTINSNDATEIYYNSQIGEIAQIIAFALKDKTTNVLKMIKFLEKIKTPYEILEENSKNKEMHKRFQELNKKLKKFVNKAKQEASDSKLLFFTYGGETSMSAEISNYLKYLYPKKYIFVCYVNQEFVNLSGRGENVLKVLEKIIKKFKDAKGGGHKNAIGGRIKSQDLERFKEELEKEIK